MKKIEEIKSILEKHKYDIEEKYGVAEIGIFGSYVKGEQKETSDVDILVEFKESIGLIKFIEIENYLTDLLEIKVDLVMKSSLKPRIGKHILEEVVYL
ncbi:MAG: nucleotidyltransferase family protein [Candidatus Poribacteria bacterium]